MSKNPNSPSTGHASNPSAIPAPMQPPRSLPKQNKVWSRFTRRIQAIPLSTKLVTCIIVLLTIGTIGISFSIRTLVGNYLLQKTDYAADQPSPADFQQHGLAQQRHRR